MTVLAPKYMERFRCIGSACEDTCCSGWRVTLDKKSHDALSAAMAESPETRAEFERNVRRLPVAQATEMTYATAERDGEGNCQFVRDDGLCSIQSRYGHELLSNTCSLYPRQIRVSSAAVELTAQVSCPEVARQLLLHEDSMDLVSLDDSVLERRLASEQVAEGDLYGHYVDEVRHTMIQFAQLRERPMRDRLFFMVFFAQKTASFFHRGVEQDPGPALSAVLDRMASPGVLDAIAAELRRVEVPLALTSTLVGEIGLVGQPVSPSFARLAQRVYATLDECRATASGGAVADDDRDRSQPPAAPSFDPEKLAALHQRRQQRLYAVAGARLDGYTERFVINYWVRRWYTASPDLLQHVRDLLIELAVAQLLLCSHPDVLAALERPEASGPDGNAALDEALDRAAVETFSRTSRCVEHSQLRPLVNERLAEMGLPAFASTTCLLAFASGATAASASPRSLQRAS